MMLIKIEPDEPLLWYLAFHKSCADEFYNRWLPSIYKHVSAFAWSQKCQVWIYYDQTLFGTRIAIAPAGLIGDAEIAKWTWNTDILQMNKNNDYKPSWRNRLIFCCTSAARRLVGVTGSALLPDQLYSDCIAQNAKVIFNG